VAFATASQRVRLLVSTGIFNRPIGTIHGAIVQPHVKALTSSSRQAAGGWACKAKQHPIALIAKSAYHSTMEGTGDDANHDAPHLANRLSESRSPYVSPRQVVIEVDDAGHWTNVSSE